MFAEIQQSTITQQIIRQIHTAIITGKLAPGDKLPSENDMIKQFGISKQTLRESLRALEHMGLIQTRKGMGGGSFIIEVDAAITKLGLLNYFYFKNLSIRDLSVVRKLVEPYSTKIATRNMTDDDIQVLHQLNATARKHLKANDYNAVLTHEIAFHMKIVEQTKNPLLVLLMEFIEDVLVDYKKAFEIGIDYLQTVLEAHESIYQAIKDRNETLASEEMLKHIIELEETLWNREKNLSLKEVYSKTTMYN